MTGSPPEVSAPGDRPYTGKLPVTWPRSVSQEPIESGTDYDPLYAFGHGLRTR